MVFTNFDGLGPPGQLLNASSAQASPLDSASQTAGTAGTWPQ